MDQTEPQSNQLCEKLLRHSDRSGYAVHNAIRITDVRVGFAQGEILAAEQAFNPLNRVHGGALAGLADTVAGYAVTSLGFQCVTSDCLMTYLRPAPAGRLTCTAQVRKAGKKVCIVNTTICDEDGTELAIGTFNFSILGELVIREDS